MSRGFYTTEIFIDKATQKHGFKYGYQKVSYVNSLKVVEIYCPVCQKYFLQQPKDHLYGHGCPICGGIKADQKTFIRKAIEVHGGKFNYENVNYINSKTKVHIFCNICKNYFYQTPAMHITKNSCPLCSGFYRTTEAFVSLAKLIHGEKYNYSDVVYTKAISEVEIFCNTCKKTFIQKACSHLSGHGCPKCHNLQLSKEEVIEKVRKIHGGKYNYDAVEYVDSQCKVKIFCNKCKSFFSQAFVVHATGVGCPKCRSSKGESKVREYLTNKEYVFEEQVKFEGCKDKRCLPFDFFLPLLNVAIEFDGIHHFKKNCFSLSNVDKRFEKVKLHDEIKNKYCEKNNIFLLRISYLEIKNIEKLLSIFLKEREGLFGRK